MVLALAFTTESYVALSKPSGTVDRTKGIIYGLRIVNPESANGRCYPQPVLKKAIPLYENADCYWGHRRNPSDTDDPTPKFGRWKNVREAGDGGLVGDLHSNPKLADFEPFAWACENDPSFYCLSHHAATDWEKRRRADGKKVCENLRAIASVDVVSRGGTTTSVYESDESGAKTMIDAKAIAAELTDKDALAKFLADLFGALPASESKQALTDVLSSMTPAPPADDAPSDSDATVAATESLSQLGKLGKWASGKLRAVFTKESLEKKRVAAVALCTKEGLKTEYVTEAFLGSILSLPEATAKELIADRKKIAGAGGGTSRARTSPPGDGSNTNKPVSVKEMVAETDFS